MKYKLTLFSLAFFVLLISLSSVYAFESDVYHIGIEIPLTDDASEEETPIYGDNGDDSSSPGGSSSYNDDDEDNLITITAETTDTNVTGEETGEEITLGEPSEKGFFATLTGAVVGGVTNFAKSGIGNITLVTLIVLLTTFIIVRKYRLRKQKQPTSSATQESPSETIK